MRTIYFILLSCFLFQACGPRHNNFAAPLGLPPSGKDLVLKTFYNPDEGSSLALGYGYSPFEPDVPKDAPFTVEMEKLDSPASLVTTIEIHAVYNQQDLANSLNYDQSASIAVIGNIGGNLGGSRSGMRSSTFSETDFSLVIKAKSEYGLARIKNWTWKKEALELYTSDDSLFARKYGLKYTVAKSLGTSLYIVVNFHNINKTDKEEIQSKLNAGISIKAFSAKVSSTMKKIMSEAIQHGSVDYYVLSNGGLGNFTGTADIITLLSQDASQQSSVLKFDSLTKSLNTFIQSQKFSSETAVPTGYYCVEYYDLGLKKIKPFVFEHTQQIMLEKIARRYDKYSGVFRQVNDILNHGSEQRGVMSDEQLQTLTNALPDLSKYLDGLKATYKSVLNGNLTTPMPADVPNPIIDLDIRYSTSLVPRNAGEISKLDTFNYVIKGQLIDRVYIEIDTIFQATPEGGISRFIEIYDYKNIYQKPDSAGLWWANSDGIHVSNKVFISSPSALCLVDQRINQIIGSADKQAYLRLYLVCSNFFGIMRKQLLGRVILQKNASGYPKVLYNIRNSD